MEITNMYTYYSTGSQRIESFPTFRMCILAARNENATIDIKWNNLDGYVYICSVYGDSTYFYERELTFIDKYTTALYTVYTENGYSYTAYFDVRDGAWHNISYDGDTIHGIRGVVLC